MYIHKHAHTYSSPLSTTHATRLPCCLSKETWVLKGHFSSGHPQPATECRTATAWHSAATQALSSLPASPGFLDLRTQATERSPVPGKEQAADWLNLSPKNTQAMAQVLVSGEGTPLLLFSMSLEDGSLRWRRPLLS